MDFDARETLPFPNQIFFKAVNLAIRFLLASLHRQGYGILIHVLKCIKIHVCHTIRNSCIYDKRVDVITQRRQNNYAMYSPQRFDGC